MGDGSWSSYYYVSLQGRRAHTTGCWLLERQYLIGEFLSFVQTIVQSWTFIFDEALLNSSDDAQFLLTPL